MVISHFCHDVITRRAAARPVLDPFFLNYHSVINNVDLLFKFHMYIVSIMGKIAVVLICFFRMFAKEMLSMLSTNFWDSPLRLYIISSVIQYFESRGTRYFE